MSQRRYLFIVTGSLLSLAALLAGLYLGGAFRKPLTDLSSATLYPPDFRKLADFELSDQDDQTYTLNQLKGQWSLIFFGYSYCPDICPTTLYLMQQVNLLRKESDTPHPLQYIFVSVDPDRDTPERMKEYVQYFDPDFIGLSGEKDEIDKLVNSLGVYYHRQTPADDENYLVDHSAGLFLINPDGEPQALFSAPHTATNLAQDINLITEYYGN